MTDTRNSRLRRVLRPLLTGAIVLASSGSALAWQSSTPLVAAPPSNTQFQQTVQQQQVSDQLQKSQLQQQLHQSVSDMAKHPASSDTSLQKQLRQADQAQRDRDRAAQQDQVDRYRSQAALPRVVPQPLPATASSGH
ncbi:MAG: hypothetical protein WC617_17225 [Rhodanobacter sp.]|jgi:hypothetical protein